MIFIPFSPVKSLIILWLYHLQILLIKEWNGTYKLVELWVGFEKGKISVQTLVSNGMISLLRPPFNTHHLWWKTT